MLQGEVGDEFPLEEERPLQGHDGFHSGRLRRSDGSLELLSANTDMITLSIGFYVFRPGRLALVQTAACDVALVFFNGFRYTSTMQASSLTLAGQSQRNILAATEEQSRHVCGHRAARAGTGFC